MTVGTSASLAYACYFDLIYVAQILLAQDPGISILNTRLELDADVDLAPFPTSAYGTVLHIAAALKKPSIVELLIERGADTKAIAGSGFTMTVLHSALDFYVYKSCTTTEECCEVVKLLLAHGADPNPSCVAETPLQVAVRSCAGLAAVQALIDAGADVNAIGVDEAILAKIRYDLRDEEDQNIVDKAVHSRGNGHYFDTPLRIAENRRNQIPSENLSPEFEKQLPELRELLGRYGAKSLHLFPVEG
jgi:Ankyrin repeats (3 copies)